MRPHFLAKVGDFNSPSSGHQSQLHSRNSEEHNSKINSDEKDAIEIRRESKDPENPTFSSNFGNPTKFRPHSNSESAEGLR